MSTSMMKSSFTTMIIFRNDIIFDAVLVVRSVRSSRRLCQSRSDSQSLTGFDMEVSLPKTKCMILSEGLSDSNLRVKIEDSDVEK